VVTFWIAKRNDAQFWFNGGQKGSSAVQAKWWCVRGDNGSGGGRHCFWRVVSGELVSGELVCGQLVCGQLVSGQVVSERAVMAMNGQCMMAMHAHRCNREPVVAMIPLSSLSLRDWNRSSVPYPTLGGARTMSPTTGHTATASCEEGVTGGRVSALDVSRRDATTRRRTYTCSSQLYNVSGMH